MDNNNDLLYWKLGQMNAAKGYAAAAKGRGGNNGPANAEVLAYITGLTTPLSSGQVTLIDTFVTSLKTGLSITTLDEVFDVMYILAGETQESSLRNLVKNAHHCTLDGTSNPSFTAIEGFTGNVAQLAYIKTNYNPNSQGVRLSLNSASYGFYLRLDPAGADQPDMGQVVGGASLQIYSGFTDNKMYVKIHSGGYSSWANTDRSGMYIGCRPSSTQQILYRNKTGNTGTVNSTNIADSIITFLRGGATYSPNQIAFGFAGRSLSSTEVGIITDAIETYMDSNGKGVL